MTYIRLTKKFEFEMAHALHAYDGACKNIHGHSYCLQVCVIGSVIKAPDTTKDGMVMDFSELKNLVQKNVITEFDHALVLNERSAVNKLKFLDGLYDKVVFTSYQPSCENLLLEIVNRLKSELPAAVSLHHVSLRETSGSLAEWYAEDNILSA